MKVLATLLLATLSITLWAQQEHQINDRAKQLAYTDEHKIEAFQGGGSEPAWHLTINGDSALLEYNGLMPMRVIRSNCPGGSACGYAQYFQLISDSATAMLVVHLENKYEVLDRDSVLLKLGGCGYSSAEEPPHYSAFLVLNGATFLSGCGVVGKARKP